MRTAPSMQVDSAWNLICGLVVKLIYYRDSRAAAQDRAFLAGNTWLDQI